MGAVPGVGNFVAAYDIVKNYQQFLAKSHKAAHLNIDDPATMLAALRDSRIRQYLNTHPIPEKTKAAFWRHPNCWPTFTLSRLRAPRRIAIYGSGLVRFVGSTESGLPTA